MGVVYKAHDPVIEREVAIKAIKISFEVTPEEKHVYLHRFYREAKAAGKLNHPNIVTIFDVDEDSETGTPFIVMEFLEGTTISEVAVSGVLLPLQDINNMIIQLADALNYAHSEGVVHRDIKAANILILPGMKVKIMDFGIARLPSSDLTQSGQFMGTPNYMSPEQIDGKYQVDGRSDLFSLGVIFYMLLTGERPFAGDSFNTVSYKIVHVDPQPPRTFNANVPEAYSAMLLKLLAKRPADRYQTGAELIAAIRKLNGNGGEIEDLQDVDLDSTQASPPPVPSNAVRSTRSAISETMTIWRTSSKRRFASLGLMIFLVVALTLGSIYFIRSSSKQKAEPLAAHPTTSSTARDTVAEMSRQNAIRIKWDLAMKYVETGLPDRAIKELNDILRLDPENHDAKKFLDLVVEKKEMEIKKNAQPAPALQPPPVKITDSPRIKTEIPQKAPVPVAQVDPVPEVKLGSVDFEFDHGFSTGSFYIFTDEKLAFEGALSAEKKKVLLFKNYKGKLSGSLKIPVGEANLLVHIVCREKGISASKKITVNVRENIHYKLQIKYLKSPRQLELTLT